MSDVKFEEDWNPNRQGGGKSGNLAGWLVNHSGGMIKEESQANYVLIVLALIVIVGSFYFIKAPEVVVPPQPPTPQQLGQ